MSADAANRETSRDALATLLDAGMTNAQEVHGYLKGDLGGLSPIIMVTSVGTTRKGHGIGTSKFLSRFRFAVLIFVRDYDPTWDENYTEQEVEDTLDLLDKELADVIADNRGDDAWEYLSLEEGYTEVTSVTDEGGIAYMVEPHFVIAKVVDA